VLSRFPTNDSVALIDQRHVPPECLPVPWEICSGSLL
jgi:hypothetical protein